MSKNYKCIICGYIYKENEGDATNGIIENTKFVDIPESWTCPICGAGKEEFEELIS